MARSRGLGDVYKRQALHTAALERLYLTKVKNKKKRTTENVGVMSTSGKIVCGMNLGIY
jgi:hypothetical protein